MRKGSLLWRWPLLAAVGAAGAGLASPAAAANWIQAQGTEAPDAPAIRFTGFIQPGWQRFDARKVQGAANPLFNGRVASFNRVAPMQDHTAQFYVRRARPGIRGVIPGTDGRINYVATAEISRQNGITRNASHVEPVDVSLTFSYLPGLRLRVGQFKLPGAEEGLQAFPLVDPFMEFTPVTGQLVMARNFRAAPPGTNAPAGTAAARVVGGVNAYRDLGVQAFDAFRNGRREWAYAVMLSKASTFNSRIDNGLRQLTARVQTSWIFGGKGAFRQDFTAFAWYQHGKGRFAGENWSRMRGGAGFTFNRKPWHAAGEYIRGAGYIFNGVTPPFNTPDIASAASVALGRENKARGWYVFGGRDLVPDLELHLRYDRYDRLPNNAALQRRFEDWTLALRWFAQRPNLQFTLNYARRRLRANLDGIPAAGARANAAAVTRSMGDMLGLQATLWY